MPDGQPRAKPHTKHTIRRLQSELQYDGERGSFSLRSTGEPVGVVTRHGYVQIRIHGESFMAHRVAWAFVTGVWPGDQIDHIDGDKTNNRFANLRDVSQTVNMQNQRRPYSNNKIGLAGVYRHKANGRIYSQIRVSKKLVHLGYFDTPEQASEAFLKAKRELHPGCTI